MFPLVYFNCRYDMIIHIRYDLIACIRSDPISRITFQLNQIKVIFIHSPQMIQWPLGRFPQILELSIYMIRLLSEIQFATESDFVRISDILLLMFTFLRNQDTCCNTPTFPMETNELVILIWFWFSKRITTADTFIITEYII